MPHRALYQEKDALIREIRLNPECFIHPFGNYIQMQHGRRISSADIPLEDWLRALFESHLAGDDWGREITRILKQTSAHIKSIFPKIGEDGTMRYMATVHMSDPSRPYETRRFSVGTYDTMLAAIEGRNKALAVRDLYHRKKLTFAEADAMFAKLRVSAKTQNPSAKTNSLEYLLRNAEARASSTAKPANRQDIDKSR